MLAPAFQLPARASCLLTLVLAMMGGCAEAGSSRHGCAAVRWRDKVFVFGGTQDDCPLPTFESFDLTSGAWTSEVRAHFTALLAPLSYTLSLLHPISLTPYPHLHGGQSGMIHDCLLVIH
jgi:hypothetical protein